MMAKIGFDTLIIQMSLLLLVIGLCGLFFLHQRKRWRINRWQNALDLPKHTLVFNQLYRSVDGFSLSRQARHQQDALDYIYGEIEFVSFIALLSLTKPDEHTVFYDLGSGVGKAVLACAMVYPVRQCVGVELLPELHECANQQKNQLATQAEYIESTKKIQFILADFLKVDLSDATLIFINSTTLFGETWEQLCNAVHRAPYVETIITTSKPLISDVFISKICTEIQMSWGIVSVYIHGRKTNPIENIE
jgi:hypothetical protein